MGRRETQAARGWTMVFKAVTGANQKALDIYKSGGTFNEDQLKAIDVTNRFPNDYRNRIVLNWEDFGATELEQCFPRHESGFKPCDFRLVKLRGDSRYSLNMRKLVILFILVTCTLSVAVADHDECNADRAWKLFVCDGNQWQAIKADDILDNRGSPKNPGKSCDDIKDERPNAENGIYYITLGDSFYAYNEKEVRPEGKTTRADPSQTRLRLASPQHFDHCDD
ncbi:hypothetical protein AWC38_SpisGene4448 [Stylophora pistillata]|uniref:Uncharacterized protein n=1 Tax=Stylophora pistillata TaxID=50429 RepID=A0A2B4SQ28_STYPI|nr:hypothetical protein AWC38_SpisGene4448 [Stylophora pistillata]